MIAGRVRGRQLKRTAAQYRRRFAVGRQDIMLMLLHSAGKNLRDLRHFRIGGEKFQHSLILLGRRHDLWRRVRNTHAHSGPVNISRRHRVADEIFRTPLGLFMQLAIKQGDHFGNFARRRCAGLIAVAVFSTQGAVIHNAHIPYESVLSQNNGAQS